jgi:AraC family transcriptional regulator
MACSLHPVPVTMGSPQFHTLEVEGLMVTEARFAPGSVLAPHVHDRACFAVMLQGAFDVSFRQRFFDCPATSIHTEPPGERHSNRISKLGAHVLVIQPDPRREEVARPLAPLLERVTQCRHTGIAAMAARLARELAMVDDVAPLAIEAMALEMMVGAARSARQIGENAAPVWLGRAQEYVHQHRFDRLTVSDIAKVADVHPAHLARAFRRQLGSSVAGYVRRLRLEWAAEQLATNTLSLCDIALRAGFADQSHFTRLFKRHTGITPGEYRIRHARGHRRA